MIAYTTTQLWLFLSIFFLLFEIGAPGLFYFLSFSLGALTAAGGVEFLGIGFASQFGLFLLSTVIYVLLLKQVVFNWTKHQHLPTNIDALIGKHATVVKAIGPYKQGQVKVAGEVWKAACIKGHELEVGTHVIIIKVTGATLYVRYSGDLNSNVEK